MSRRNFGHRNGFKTSHDLQVMNFLARENCTFSTLFHHISSRKLTHSDTFFKELTLEPNLNLRICYQRYLGERTPEYNTPGWTCEFSWNVLRNMGGQILGYNSCPCSIFLDLRMQIGWRAFRNPRVEDDWTLECPEICAHIVVWRGNGLIDAI